MNLYLENLINEIENDFDCGMKVFISKTNFKIISLPNFDDSFFEENEAWNEQVNELNRDGESYVEINIWDSSFSYEIMKSFAENVCENPLKNKLLKALDKKKPFQEFKYVITFENENRQKWFEYKKMKQKNYVERELNQLTK